MKAPVRPHAQRLTWLLTLVPTLAGLTSAVTAQPPGDVSALAEWSMERVASRPGLPPVGTRSAVREGMEKDPAAATAVLLQRHAGTVAPWMPGVGPARTLVETKEEVLCEIDYAASDGSLHSFSAYFRPDDARPFYWLGSGYPSVAGASFKQARQALLERVLGGLTEGLRITGRTTLLDRTQTTLLAGPDPLDAPWPACWFFLVDDQPLANWDHPCRYVFVSPDLSSFAVQYGYAPVQPVLTSDPEITDPLEVIEPHPVVDAPRERFKVEYDQPGALAIDFEGSVQNCYVVIISGGADAFNNWPRYWGDSAYLYSTLTRKYGFRDDHIIALVSDGTSSGNDMNIGTEEDPVYDDSPTDLDGDGDVDVDGAATYAEVEAAFDDLADILTSNDQLFVFTTDHGSRESGWDVYINLWDWESLRDDQLAAMTEDLPCPVFFAMEQCYSGGFVDDLDDVATRAIGTACAYNDTSVAGTTFPDYDQWAYYFIAALRGSYPGANPWNEGTAIDADDNGDDRIAFNEAWDHAWDNRNASDVPKLGENPAGCGDHLFMQHFHVELADDTPVSYAQIPKDFSFRIYDYDWAGVGIAPSTDHHLKVDDNRALTTPYRSSIYGGTARDFVVYNGNQRLGQTTHYVQAYSGSASAYTIEAEYDIPDMAPGDALPGSLGVGEVLDLFEVDLDSGTTYDLTVDVSSGSSDIGVYVVRPGNISGSRATATWRSNTAGPGGDESIRFRAVSAGEHAVVVVGENNGWANYTLRIDEAPSLPAPTGVAASDGTYGDRIRVTWNAVADANVYQVFRNTANSSASAVLVNDWAAGTVFEDPTATAGRTYYYWVKAAGTVQGDRESAFSSSNGGYVNPTTLANDGAVTTSGEPAYYDFSDTSANWWAVGVRNRVGGENWSLRLYSTPGFSTMLKSSAYPVPVDFVVGDGNHIAAQYRGVEAYRFTGSGSGRVEYEGGTETLGTGTNPNYLWTADDVVEMFEVNLAAGTYLFRLDMISGTADLDFALFGSSDGQYYRNRQQYQAQSSGGGSGADESFTYTVSGTDNFGLCIWANDANSATYRVIITELAQGLWDGDLSTDWHTGGNWTDGIVPDAADDVTVPTGCPNYPVISSANAACNSLTIESGASATVINRRLDIDYDLEVRGQLTLQSSSACKVYVGDDVRWEAGSSGTMTGSSQMYVSGDWNFEEEAGVQLTGGYVEFEGTGDSWIRCYDPASRFFNVRADKTAGGRVCFSYLSTQPIRLNNLYQYAGSKIFGANPEGVFIEGFFNNIGGHFEFSSTYACALVYEGSPGVGLKPNTGDTLHDLVMAGPGTLQLDPSYADVLVLTGDVRIENGSLDANGVDIALEGDWVNDVGNGGFAADGGAVLFSGSGGNQKLEGATTFYDVIDERTTSNQMQIWGPITATHDCTINYQAVVMGTGSLDVLGTLDLAPANSFWINTGATVDAASLNLGGALVCNGGTVTCGDLVNAGIDGYIRVYSGTVTLQQGTGSGEYIDLLGDVIVNDGVLRLLGGSSAQSYWPFDEDASLTVNGGVLEVPAASVRIREVSGVSFSTSITGGTLRFGKNLRIDRTDFHPTGGTCELMSGTSSTLQVDPASYLHHLVINKAGVTVNATSDLDMHGDVVIQSGRLLAPAVVSLQGSWSNAVGEVGFGEGAGQVRFYGGASSGLLTDETFFDLTLDKTYPGLLGLDVEAGLTLQVGHDLVLTDGTMELNNGCTLDVDHDVTMAVGAGLNANDSGTTVRVGGDWVNQNAGFSSTVGFDPGYASVLILDGNSTTGTLQTAAASETFDTLILDRPGGLVRVYDHLLLRDDFIIRNGAFAQSGGPFEHRMGGDLIIEPGGAWYDTASTVVFQGATPQVLDHQSFAGWFKHIVVEKNVGLALVPLQLKSNVLLLGGGTLTVREGQIDLNGHYVRCTGDVTVEDNGQVWIDAGAWMEVGKGNTFLVKSGGKVDMRGEPANPARITHHSGTYRLLFESGSALVAQDAIFEYMDAGGLRLAPGMKLVEPYTLHRCTFRNGTAGGTLLLLGTEQSFSVHQAVFLDDPGGGASNVEKHSTVGRVDFVAAHGTFSGEAYDNDPLRQVNWHSGELGSVALDLPAGAVMGAAYDVTAAVSGDMVLPPVTYLWSITGLDPEMHQHGAGTDAMTDCVWYEPGSKTATIVVSNALGAVKQKAAFNVAPLSVAVTQVRRTGVTSNAVDLVIQGTTAEADYGIQYRLDLDGSDWLDAGPGGTLVTGQDVQTPWTDEGGPGRDLATEANLFYRALLLAP